MWTIISNLYRLYCLTRLMEIRRYRIGH